MNRPEAEEVVEQAVDALVEMTYEIEAHALGYDVIAFAGKTRVGVLARTRYESVATMLVRALFAEGCTDAEVPA